jgi:hypothetical protein
MPSFTLRLLSQGVGCYCKLLSGDYCPSGEGGKEEGRDRIASFHSCEKTLKGEEYK